MGAGADGAAGDIGQWHRSDRLCRVLGGDAGGTDANSAADGVAPAKFLKLIWWGVSISMAPYKSVTPPVPVG